MTTAGSRKIERRAFRQSSATYYASAKFLSKPARDDLFKMYSFTNLAHTYVDAAPVERTAFLALRKAWDEAKDDPEFDTTLHEAEDWEDVAIKNIVGLVRKYDIDPEWIEAFLDSIQSDLEGRTYETWDDTLEYIYGTAEVVAMIICKIMNADPASYESARMEGRSMQLVNFIRCLPEANARGRCYFPRNELDNFGLADLSLDTAQTNQEAFEKFIQRQLVRYEGWQTKASKGESYVPKAYRVAIVTAVDMCNWMATSISRDPMAIFGRKVKPAKNRVLVTGLCNLLAL
ncbi:MAG TPA: squalene/phytoene synthase family protein [Candidatus Saccharimonadales bacterium]|nr:squalene/phytoene synthase family protein [Candidatus Saccharimonadales bacterium]